MLLSEKKTLRHRRQNKLICLIDSVNSFKWKRNEVKIKHKFTCGFCDLVNIFSVFIKYINALTNWCKWKEINCYFLILTLLIWIINDAVEQAKVHAFALLIQDLFSLTVLFWKKIFAICEWEFRTFFVFNTQNVVIKFGWQIRSLFDVYLCFILSNAGRIRWTWTRHPKYSRSWGGRYCWRCSGYAANIYECTASNKATSGTLTRR